jgi:hypothetical protein
MWWEDKEGRQAQLKIADIKKQQSRVRRWLTLVILATQEAEIRRIMVWSQPGKTVPWDPSSKNPFTKKDWWSGSRYRPWVPKKKKKKSQAWEYMPVILATQEAEIRRIKVWSQPRENESETLSWENPIPKRADGMAQGAGPKFKPHYWKKKLLLPYYLTSNNGYH